MAEDQFKNTIIAMVLFVAFTILILTVAIDFGAEYGRDANEIGGGSLDIVDFQSTADDVEGNAQSYRSRFESGQVDNIDDASGIFSVATDMINMITAPFRLISQILINLLGIPRIMVNLILGLLSIGLILGIWRVLRTGS